jgi:hypothetical protein
MGLRRGICSCRCLHAGGHWHLCLGRCVSAWALGCAAAACCCCCPWPRSFAENELHRCCFWRHPCRRVLIGRHLSPAHLWLPIFAAGALCGAGERCGCLTAQRLQLSGLAVWCYCDRCEACAGVLPLWHRPNPDHHTLSLMIKSRAISRYCSSCSSEARNSMLQNILPKAGRQVHQVAPLCPQPAAYGRRHGRSSGGLWAALAMVAVATGCHCIPGTVGCRHHPCLPLGRR